MPTAVVVATIVNTNMSEAGFRQHMVEQLQVNDRKLLDRLADADGDANVVTAVMNVDEFLAYLIRRFPKAVDAAFSTREAVDSGAVAEATEPTTEQTIETAKMSEGEFMDYMLQQLESGKVEPLVRFSDNTLGPGMDHEMDNTWEDDGDIGEDFSRHPYYY